SGHRAGNVNQHDGPSAQLFSSRNALEHRLLERLFPLLSAPRCSLAAEWQHARGAHGAERGENEIFVHTHVAHVAQVAEQSQRTELLLAEQALPSLALVSTRAQRHFPSVRSGEFSGDQALPHFGLRLVTRLGVSEEQNVAQLDGSAAIVLRERVRIELRESRSQPLLHLS